MNWAKSALLSVGFHITNLIFFILLWLLFTTVLGKLNLDSMYINLATFFLCMFISYRFYSWYKLKRVAFDSDDLAASQTRKWNYYILIGFVVIVIALVGIANVGVVMRQQTNKFTQKQQTTGEFSGTKEQRAAQKKAKQAAIKTARGRAAQQKELEAKE